MSDDETLVAVFSFVGAGVGWGRWYWRLAVYWKQPPSGGRLGLLAVMPVVAGLVLFAILRWIAAEDVRHDPVYLGFYLLMGAAWVVVACHALTMVGLSVRSEAVERGNRATSLAVAGALIGLTLCFGGGNVGNGPGWWVVVFAAWLATGALCLLWAVLARTTGLVDAVAIDRDLAAGVRAGGFFVGVSLVLGSAVAGDWQSVGATLADFGGRGWPALVVAALAGGVEWGLSASVDRRPAALWSRGVLPAIVYVAAGAMAAAAFRTW